jgi:hypothetical protein
MIKKLSPNRTICGEHKLDKDSDRMHLSRAVSTLRTKPTDKLYEIIRNFPIGRWTKAAEIVIDERIAKLPKIKPDNT